MQEKSQMKCPICGRFCETLDTESGNQVQTCISPNDLDNPHIVSIMFLTKPELPGEAGDIPGNPAAEDV